MTATTNEKIYADLLGAATTGFIVLDNNRAVVFWNEWIAKVSGLDLKAALGRPLSAVFPEIEGSRLETAIDIALNDRSSSYLSYRINRTLFPFSASEGAVRPMMQNVTITPRTTGEGHPGCVIQVADVTYGAERELLLKQQARELRRARDELERRVESRTLELRESRQQFRDFAESGADWFWEMDEKLRFTYMSPNVRRILGATAEWHYGKTWEKIIGGDYDRDAWEDHLRVLRAHEPFRDFTYRAGAGVKQKWFSTSGKPVFDGAGKFLGYRGTGSSISELKRADEALKESEAQLRLVTDSLPVLIAYIDADERFQFINETAIRWIGRERQDIIGQKIEDLHPSIYERLRPHIRSVLAGQNVTFEESVTLGDGVTRDIWVSYVPHVSTAQEVIGYFALAEDITERRATEAQLQQAQKMEAVGQLTGGVAHDFNNLLGVVIGNLDFLGDAVKDDAGKHRLVKTALQAALSGAELTNRLLAFSRKQALQPEVMDLNALVSGMTDLLKRTLGETIVVQTALAPGLGKVEIDRAQLESALLNLAVNARHAMADGGGLTIESGNVEFNANDADRRQDVAPGHYVMLAVSDTGTGMTPEVMERVFDPFFTTKDVGEGSGLGLSMVHGFVKQSGGHVSIDSEVGAGTTIRMYFPASAASAPAVQKKAAKTQYPLGSGETVLIVEDSEDLRLLAATIVSSLGYKVLEASDGASALTVLNDDVSIDLLFTDVVLPHGMNGVKLASAALARRPDLKVLYASGHTADAIEGVLDADIELIAKPYRRAELADRLRRALDG